ncbi:MAG: hypothetical protein KatS3mg040_1118 [Candidatus Kapaibacterium sp.]|nr:MAG: hypothetical protein KatS3mg040_1118 [Candidatus Kapabacteria bacterium]
MIELLLHRSGRILYGITLRNAGKWSARGWTALPASDVSVRQAESMRHALALQLGFSPEAFIVPKQIHGTTIAVVDGRAPSEPADGVVTNRQGILLGVTCADCCGVLLWDEHQSVIAAVHSGWRGTAGNIAGRCVRLLCERFGVVPSSLHAWLSPCASGARYVVGYDVAAHFPRSSKPRQDGSYLFDNTAEIRLELLEAGLSDTNIASAGICTIENENFHSYRRDGDRSGRMVAFIGIQQHSLE